MSFLPRSCYRTFCPGDAGRSGGSMPNAVSSALAVPTHSSTLCVPPPPANSRTRLMPCLATLGDHLPAARVTARAK